MATGKLTALAADRARRERQPVMLCDGGGLYFRKQTRDGAAWTLRYRFAGRARWMTLNGCADGLGSPRTPTAMSGRSCGWIRRRTPGRSRQRDRRDFTRKDKGVWIGPGARSATPARHVAYSRGRTRVTSSRRNMSGRFITTK
jgi:hypothetical protein